jgi:PAS domain-containing protein
MLPAENAGLCMRLNEAGAALRAVRSGERVAPGGTDATGPQDFTLQGKDAASGPRCCEILAREAAARQLLETVLGERDRLAALVRSISDEVWFADTNGVFTLANPKGMEEFSLGALEEIPVEALAMSLEVYRGDGSPRPAAEAPPLRALSGEAICCEDEIVRKNTGEVRIVQEQWRHFRGAAGDIVRSCGMLQDITERKQSEEQIKESLAEKEVMLREIHHRVKNNLQVISSLLSLQSDTVSDSNILNELVGNALKHAFPNGGGGEVRVGLDLDPAVGTVRLWVCDNGSGLPAGLDWRQSNSLGLRLVQMLVKQLRGTMTTGTGPGTGFQVAFSLERFQS